MYIYLEMICYIRYSGKYIVLKFKMVVIEIIYYSYGVNNR